MWHEPNVHIGETHYGSSWIETKEPQMGFVPKTDLRRILPKITNRIKEKDDE
jgi:hypothetical protein